jgi:hypothetical protein
MTDLKKRTLTLSSGRQIKLYGDCLAINRNLEIGEGYAPNILSLIEEQQDGKAPGSIANPHKLTVDELLEIADFSMQLWMELKVGLRRYGQIDPRIFGQDLVKAPTAKADKPVTRRKRKNAEEESQ